MRADDAARQHNRTWVNNAVCPDHDVLRSDMGRWMHPCCGIDDAVETIPVKTTYFAQCAVQQVRHSAWSVCNNKTESLGNIWRHSFGHDDTHDFIRCQGTGQMDWLSAGHQSTCDARRNFGNMRQSAVSHQFDSTNIGSSNKVRQFDGAIREHDQAKTFAMSGCCAPRPNSMGAVRMVFTSSMDGRTTSRPYPLPSSTF